MVELRPWRGDISTSYHRPRIELTISRSKMTRLLKVGGEIIKIDFGECRMGACGSEKGERRVGDKLVRPYHW